MLNPWILLLIATGYLFILFALAWLSDRGILSTRISRSPLIHTLAQGTFISAWGYYGVISLAHSHGYGSLAYYLGAGAMLLFAPFVLMPLSKIANQFQLNSLADLLVFRFPATHLGLVTTILLVCSALPLLALQIKAVAESWGILSSADIAIEFNWLHAALFVAITTTFALFFGAGRLNLNGLAVTLAAESIFKLAGILAAGAVAVYVVFGGVEGLNEWLVEHPSQRDILYNTNASYESPWLVLAFLSGSLLVPHALNYNNGRSLQRKTLRLGTWLIPLYLLLMALPIFPIIWAAHELNAPLSNTDYVALGVAYALDNQWLLTLILFGGLSAATGTFIVLIMTITTMILNHLFLPRANLPANQSLYQWLANKQRVAILCFALTAYAFTLLVKNSTLTDLAFTAFSGTLQLLPALCALVAWPAARGKAIYYGLVAGSIAWSITMLIPLIIGQHHISLEALGIPIAIGPKAWLASITISFGLNLSTLLIVHNRTQISRKEKETAALCGLTNIATPAMERLVALTPHAIVEALTPSLGAKVAQSEVRRALQHMGLDLNERRPAELRKVRDQIEANLSGLVGKSIAKEVVEDNLPLREEHEELKIDLVQLEEKVAKHRAALPGIAGELDRLRLHHRNTLEQLPVGVSTFSSDGEIMLWNSALQDITGVERHDAVGTTLKQLPEPWGELLHTFIQSGANYERSEIQIGDSKRFLDLHKTKRDQAANTGTRILLIEDRTKLEQLQHQLLHKERLSSLGRLAAGVAHEIGNPVTAITCLAQELEDGVSSSETTEIAQQMQDQTRRITEIVQSMINFAHPGQRDHAYGPLSLIKLISDAKALVDLQPDRTKVNFSIDVAEDIQVLGDNTKLSQVFLNLLANACDASQPGDRVHLSARHNDNWCFIDIVDEGTGIKKEHQAQLFDPFFTTKEVGKGTGLGLAIVYNIVREHGGELQVESPALPSTKGTKFTLSLKVFSG